MSFYYVTSATGKEFITNYSQYAVRSLIAFGVDPSDVHVIVNKEKDRTLFSSLVPEVKNFYVAGESLGHIGWKYMGGKRKYSLFKAAGLYKFFSEPKEGSKMVYFDGDVLFFKHPEPFLKKYEDKTWFHHGKTNENCAYKRTKKNIKKEQIKLDNYKSLSDWVSAPCAWLMQKHGAKIVPDLQICAGFYIMHPKDHEAVIRLTYEYCKELANEKKFDGHPDVGDQKPMNAALSVLETDFHGGSRFDCPEHEEYFIHYFGSGAQKSSFQDDLKRIKSKI